jgi:hypothetical protein
VAVGDSALFNQSVNGSGFYSNTAVGSKVLYSNTTGYDNTANGFQALYSNTAGYRNTADGFSALISNASGYDNTANGYAALLFNITGFGNIAVGSHADVSSFNLNNATAIGYNTTVDASNKVRIGNASVTSIGGQVGWTSFSDGRYKKNIKEDVQGLAFINTLRPITYTIDIDGLNAFYDKGRKDVTDQMDAKGKEVMQQANDEAGKIVYNGFIAQEVEAAAQKLHYNFSGVDKPKDKDGLYGLRYSDFVVPLVKAVQELSKMNDDKDAKITDQNKKIDEQQKEIDELKTMMLQLQQNFNSCSPCGQVTTQSSQQSIMSISNASLQQNIPNPFSNSSSISYYIPSGFHSAQLVMTDISGHVLKTWSITQSGSGKQIISGSELTGGMYQYSLLIDGKTIDTKKMVISK